MNQQKTEKTEKPTLQDKWREYRDACYPDGISGIQNREIHQAFFAGALIAFTTTDNNSKGLSDEEGAVQLGKLVREALEVCQHWVISSKQQN